MKNNKEKPPAGRQGAGSDTSRAAFIYPDYSILVNLFQYSIIHGLPQGAKP